MHRNSPNIPSYTSPTYTSPPNNQNHHSSSRPRGLDRPKSGTHHIRQTVLNRWPGHVIILHFTWLCYYCVVATLLDATLGSAYITGEMIHVCFKRDCSQPIKGDVQPIKIGSRVTCKTIVTKSLILLIPTVSQHQSHKVQVQITIHNSVLRIRTVNWSNMEICKEYYQDCILLFKVYF